MDRESGDTATSHLTLEALHQLRLRFGFQTPETIWSVKKLSQAAAGSHDVISWRSNDIMFETSEPDEIKPAERLSTTESNRDRTALQVEFGAVGRTMPNGTFSSPGKSNSDQNPR